MTDPLIKEILALPGDGRELRVHGWVRTRRDLKNLSFLEVNDGSCLRSVQCVFAAPPAGGDPAWEAAPWAAALARVTTGAAVVISGRLTASGGSQTVEIAADGITVLGEAPAEASGGIPAYPLQKKRHSFEFLREIAHLRARTNTFGAVARVRNRLAFAAHEFFQKRGYQYLNTPVITASDAEGAGAMFQVTTLDSGTPGSPPDGMDYTKDFFGKKTFLTVSGQLEAETYAAALSRVYTFGPTFRAENSNTTRHLAEFWMIEPETAFMDLDGNMDLAEDFLKFLFTAALNDCAEDLAFFEAHIEKGITETLRLVAESRFTHITYTDAIKELEKAGAAFDYRPSWGCDLQSEHEKYLTEKTAGGPVIVTGYPKEIKAFYMKQNDDGKTVRAMDVLVPRLGEIIGGSEREDNLDRLTERMRETGMDTEHYSWYLDLRRYGTVPHAGFGMGFERLIQYVTGMANIRDVIPYPRAAGQADF
ncbi:MAG: asparagine--tRNA ligase [Spirochaetaceae bacterium]|jgi:asparaginyl-tRNA synthetase|nr:asparagine--tRNA ligase [Spirochaetaceae bacterium]